MSSKIPLSDYELAELSKFCQKWWDSIEPEVKTNDMLTIGLASSLDFLLFVAGKELDSRMFPQQEDVSL